MPLNRYSQTVDADDSEPGEQSLDVGRVVLIVTPEVRELLSRALSTRGAVTLRRGRDVQAHAEAAAALERYGALEVEIVTRDAITYTATAWGLTVADQTINHTARIEG